MGGLDVEERLALLRPGTVFRAALRTMYGDQGPVNFGSEGHSVPRPQSLHRLARDLLAQQDRRRGCLCPPQVLRDDPLRRFSPRG